MSSGITGETPVTPIVPVASSPPTPAAANETGASTLPVDNVQISEKGAQVAKYIEQARIQQARVLPELNADTVKKIKAAIADGNYPPPALVEGIINLAGTNFAAQQQDKDHDGDQH